jgi:hypothetical protein
VSDPAAQYRAELDFEITFSNGGSLRGSGFRIDIDDPGLTEPGLGAALAADLGLLMADRVEIRRYWIISERHKRAARADRGEEAGAARSLLLAAGIPVCEHLTNLDAVPAAGFWFSAVPPAVAGFGTFPVRAYATWYGQAGGRVPQTSAWPLTRCSWASR